MDLLALWLVALWFIFKEVLQPNSPLPVIGLHAVDLVGSVVGSHISVVVTRGPVRLAPGIRHLYMQSRGCAIYAN
jgi:hypothetical protein